MPQSPVTLFLVFPHRDYAGWLQSVAQSLDQVENYVLVDRPEHLYQHIAACQGAPVVLAEFLWDGQDYSEHYNVVLSGFPQVAFALLTQAPPESYPALFPAPIHPLPQDESDLIPLLQSLGESLQGQALNGYEIREFAGQSHLARFYTAHQSSIHRDVLLQIGWRHLGPDGIASFNNRASSQARNTQPAIYAVYESFMIGNRPALTQEPVQAPTLYQLQIQQVPIESRTISRVINTAATALLQMRQMNLPHDYVLARHLTLSRQGVVRMLNIANDESSLPDAPTQAMRLGYIVAPFASSGSVSQYPRLAKLIHALQNRQMGDLETVRKESSAIDTELAPVKNLPQRKEKEIAMQQVKKARTQFWISVGAGAVVASIFAVFLIISTTKKVVVLPGTDFKEQIKIPPGIVTLPNGSTLDLPEFHIDKHEVTIAQYEKFLSEVADIDPAAYLGVTFAGSKKSFKPAGWDSILAALKRIRKYEGTGDYLTWDTPVFNVDYFDALAYAKWKGKRLPTDLEWIRAASGDKSQPFPWGTAQDFNVVNTGKGRGVKGDTSPNLDGWIGACPVNKDLGDRSPFGVLNMGGNVSEWVDSDPRSRKPSEGQRRIHGGNFALPQLVPNNVGFNKGEFESQLAVGFRLASGEPVN